MRWAFPAGLSLRPDAIRAVQLARRGQRLLVAARRSISLTRWAFPVGLSLSPDAIRAVQIARRGRRLRVAARRSVPLKQGTLGVGPAGLAIADEGTMVEALKEALALAPGRAAEVGLAIPDACCMAQVQRFPELKARGEELRALLLWQAADLLPYPPKEARLTCQVLHREGTAGQVALLLTHEALLAQLETLLLKAGGALLFAGSALTCLHNVWDGATGGRGSEGLLHLAGGALGFLLRQDGRPVYVRSVPLADGDGEPATIVREVEASLEYATTRDGLSLPPSLLLAGEGDLPSAAGALERGLRIPVEILGDGVPAWGASWEGLPPTPAEAAAAGAALSPAGDS